jgi:hypothetical protein
LYCRFEVIWLPVTEIVMTRLSYIAAIFLIAVLPAAARADNINALPTSPSKPSLPESASAAVTTSLKPDSVAKSAVETRIGAAWDCDMKNKSPLISVSANHGTIAIRDIIAPACGEHSVRQAGIFYKSEPSFKGEDMVWVTGFSVKGSINFSLRVQVN